MTDKLPDKRSSGKEISAFLNKANALPARREESAQRLIFALDATASREPTWAQARALHSEMFEVGRDLGGIEIQLCYFRGFGEFYASPWGRSSAQLHDQMAGVHCQAGYTQIKTLLKHGLAEARRNSVKAIVFIGDACEESADVLCGLAGECGLKKVPVFIFQEGNDPDVASVFKRVCRLSGGAYARFDSHSASQLRDLLRAVASYVSGGVDALGKLQDNAARHLLQQL